jgi:hypothetical protein
MSGAASISRGGWLLPVLLAAAAVHAAAGPPPPGLSGPADEGVSPPPLEPGDGGLAVFSMRRLLRDFDFEEAEAAPHEMPINFYRFIEPDDGFPPFGRMRLTDEAAFGGNWSFGFELEGGSLSARVPTAVLPVLPMADYAVSVRVRTSGLTHARARLVAWFHDAEGRTILESKVYSRPIRTEGDWALVSVQVAGDFANATDLVIELQLVQPRQFASRDAAGGPLVEDVTGAAWFGAAPPRTCSTAPESPSSKFSFGT